MEKSRHHNTDIHRRTRKEIEKLYKKLKKINNHYYEQQTSTETLQNEMPRCKDQRFKTKCEKTLMKGGDYIIKPAEDLSNIYRDLTLGAECEPKTIELPQGNTDPFMNLIYEKDEKKLDYTFTGDSNNLEIISEPFDCKKISIIHAFEGYRFIFKQLSVYWKNNTLKKIKKQEFKKHMMALYPKNKITFDNDENIPYEFTYKAPDDKREIASFEHDMSCHITASLPIEKFINETRAGKIKNPWQIVPGFTYEEKDAVEDSYIKLCYLILSQKLIQYHYGKANLPHIFRCSLEYHYSDIFSEYVMEHALEKLYYNITNDELEWHDTRITNISLALGKDEKKQCMLMYLKNVMRINIMENEKKLIVTEFTTCGIRNENVINTGLKKHDAMLKCIYMYFSEDKVERSGEISFSENSTCVKGGKTTIDGEQDVMIFIEYRISEDYPANAPEWIGIATYNAVTTECEKDSSCASILAYNMRENSVHDFSKNIGTAAQNIYDQYCEPLNGEEITFSTDVYYVLP